MGATLVSPSKSGVLAVGEYKGLKLNLIEIVVDDDSVDTRIGELLGKLDMAGPECCVSAGTAVTVSYELRECEDAHADGGQPVGMSGSVTAMVGNGEFDPEVEKAIVGLRCGERAEVELRFPATHVNEMLRGACAHAILDIEAIEGGSRPELTDELVRSISDFSGVDQLRAEVRIDLERENEAEVYNYLLMQVKAQLVEGSNVAVSENAVQERVAAQRDGMEKSLAGQYGSLEAYLEQRGSSVQEFESRLAEEARDDLAFEMVLGEIARIEEISVSESEVAAELGKLAEASGTTVSRAREYLEDMGMHDVMRAAMLREKTVDFILGCSSLGMAA